MVAQHKLIDKTKTGEKLPSLEVVEVVLVQCNLVDNQYQQKSEVNLMFTVFSLLNALGIYIFFLILGWRLLERGVK